jgi:VIT1/CCC1 family predicted Fe2+/Mn2+ transporter
MSQSPPPTPPAQRFQPTPNALNTPLVVVFSLLLCAGLPILPIYLGRKGKLPGVLTIGLAVAWVAFVGAAVSFCS